MVKFIDGLNERQRRIAMRPNAHLYIRHDAWRFMPSDAPRYHGRELVKYFWPKSKDERAGAAALDIDRDRMGRSEIATLRSLAASLRFKLAQQMLGAICHKYNSNQPRVPAGSSQGGQWVSGGDANSERPNDSRAQSAASDRLPIGPRVAAKLALEIAKRAIEAFRSEKGLYDLFRNKTGVVTYAEIDGKQYFGTNSRSLLFDSLDRADTVRLRDRLLSIYPDRFDSFGAPTNALYHAETNILLRLARDNGGTLAGRRLEIFTDTPLCGNCRSVLPFVGNELGNPTVTFIGPNGRRDTMRDGHWISEE